MPDLIMVGEESTQKGNEYARKGKKAHEETGLSIGEMHLRMDEREDRWDGLKDKRESKDRQVNDNQDNPPIALRS